MYTQTFDTRSEAIPQILKHLSRPVTAVRGAGCAGIFTGHAALELYCEVFDGEDSLDR